MRLASLLETKVVVSGATFCVVVYKRDAQCAAFLLGAVCNALLSKILKRIINKSRPKGAQLSDPGMPSSHAQSLFFFAGYLSLAALQSPMLPTAALRWLAASAIAGLAAALTLLRVRDGLHTVAQVSVGACIGAVNGSVFFRLSPTVEQRLAAIVSGSGAAPSSLFVGLIVAGALLVGSVERVFARRLKAKK